MERPAVSQGSSKHQELLGLAIRVQATNPPPPEASKTRLGRYLSGLTTDYPAQKKRDGVSTPRSPLCLKYYDFTENMHSTTLFLLVATFAP